MLRLLGALYLTMASLGFLLGLASQRSAMAGTSRDLSSGLYVLVLPMALLGLGLLARDGWAAAVAGVLSLALSAWIAFLVVEPLAAGSVSGIVLLPAATVGVLPLLVILGSRDALLWRFEWLRAGTGRTGPDPE